MAETNRIAVQLKQFWRSRTVKQRWLLGAAAAVTVALVSVFANLMATPEYKPLMSGLEASDTQTITGELKAKNIPYQVSPDGKSISVPSEQLDSARLEIASNQSTRSGRMGFEIFDKVSWGQTEFDEKVNYQRALEGELERTIGTLGNVKTARVHLVIASDSVFLDRDRGAKASVTLRLARGGLTLDEASAIQRMVAGAVDGLKPTDVSIIDADSNETLGAATDTSVGGMERLMTQKLISTLGPVVGAEHLRTSVNIEYDPTTSEESEEKFDPSVSATLQIQRSDDESGSKPSVGGVPGTTSNVPQKLPNVPTASLAEDGNNEVHKTESATYGVNKTTRHLVTPSGRIKRITAAILVDDAVTRKLEKNGKWSETPIKRSAQELQQLQSLAQDAIGIDAARGDVITVQNLSFVSQTSVDNAPASLMEQTRRGLSDYATGIRYVMLLVLFTLAYILMIQPLQRRVLAEVEAGPNQPAIAGPDAGVIVPLSMMGGGLGTPALKEQVIQQVAAEPVKSARVLQAWMREGSE